MDEAKRRRQELIDAGVIRVDDIEAPEEDSTKKSSALVRTKKKDKKKDQPK